VTLCMELRSVSESDRVIVGVVAPYDELTYLTLDPAGERIRRGAFSRSIAHRGTSIPLLRNHDVERRMGTSRVFRETDDGLVGEFVVNDGEPGDALLLELRQGYLAGLSVGFTRLRSERAADGARDVTEAKLVEVSTVGVPAYEGAAVLSVRSAQNLDELLAPFRNPPVVDLSPIPPLVFGR
jgi:Escherichia/Staphylococcus phage prohead protease